MSNQAAQELQAYVRRVESVEDEINVLNQDKSAIYKEAKANGFNTKTLRKVIAARRMDETERQEQDAEFELYWNAVHGIEPDLVRAHVENIEEFDAETGEITEPQVAPQPVQAGAIGISSPSVENEGAAISTPIQPETANHEGEAQKVERRSPKPEDAGSIPATFAIAGSSNGRTAEFDSVNAGSTPAPASTVTPIRPAKQYRPLCQNRDLCGASGPKECWKCLKAAEQGSAA